MKIDWKQHWMDHNGDHPRTIFVLARACIELDRIFQGKGIGFEFVELVSKKLNQYISDLVRNGFSSTIGNPLYQATVYSVISDDNPRTTITEVSSRLARIVTELERRETMPPTEVARVRDFLVEVGNKYLSIRGRNSIYGY